MAAVEILTKVTENGDVVIPRTDLEDIPAGSAVRVLILWEESIEAEQAQSNINKGPLNSLIARIQSRSLLPAYTPSQGKILAEDWLNPVKECDADFAVNEWNQEWDEIESLIEAEEDADQERTMYEIHNTLRGMQL